MMEEDWDKEKSEVRKDSRESLVVLNVLSVKDRIALICLHSSGSIGESWGKCPTWSVWFTDVVKVLLSREFNPSPCCLLLSCTFGRTEPRS